MSYTDVSIKKRDTLAKPPTSTLSPSPRPGQASVHGKSMGTFVGNVYLHPILKAQDILVADVNFLPCARTNWHKHEKGQLLKVTAGSGWVCDQGEKPRRINAGDVIWCPPGGIHWHGADDESYMVHTAISHGGIDWYESVSDAEYAAKD